ncbi:MAG: DUF2203 domain-containing protein [Deltaproteobacteria bacterium]|nr:DUF2203 domain-containing protein [Deltaproteobacteria bacterium]MBI3076362.1 DUF2203 domain-containing protein [Deltaproteobacteria bacterium]
MAKRFTVGEANRLLPWLEMLLIEMGGKKLEIERLRAELTEVSKGAVAEGPVAPAVLENLRRLNGTVVEFNQMLEALHDRGIILRDVESGLVDFPAELDGQEAFLCWQLGEKEIGYWHELDAGYAGRKPLPEKGQGPN